MGQSNKRHTEARGLTLTKEDWSLLDSLAHQRGTKAILLVRQLVRETLLQPRTSGTADAAFNTPLLAVGEPHGTT